MLYGKQLSQNSTYKSSIDKIVAYLAKLNEKSFDLTNFELKNKLIDKILEGLGKFKIDDPRSFVELKKSLLAANLLKPFEEIIDRTMFVLMDKWLQKTCININEKIFTVADQDFPAVIKLLLKSLTDINAFQKMIEVLREKYMEHQDKNKRELRPQERRFLPYEHNLNALDNKIKELIRDLLPKILEEQKKLNEIKERESKEMELKKVEDDLMEELQCPKESFDIGRFNDLINKYNQTFFKILYQLKKPELERLSELTENIKEKYFFTDEDKAEIVKLLRTIELKMNDDSNLLYRLDQLNKLIAKRKIEIAGINYKNRIGLNELYLNTLAQRSAGLHEAYRQTDNLADNLDKLIRE